MILNDDNFPTYYGAGAPDMVYSFNLTQPKSIALYCQSSFQSLIYVKSSTANFSNSLAFDEFPYVDSDTDSSLVTGVLQPGTYYVIVDGYNSDSFGTFNLSLSTFNPVCALNPASTPVMEVEPNDDDNNFSKATYLGAVPQGSDAVGQGHVDSYFDHVDTWRFTAPVDGNYTISADCFDDGTGRSQVGFDLYDSRHYFVNASPDNAEPDQMVTYLQAGDYYVGVYANDQNAPSADYHLVVQGMGFPTATLTATPTGTWSTPTDSPTVTTTLTVTSTPTAAITPTAIGTPITITSGPSTVTVVGSTTLGGPDNFQQPVPGDGGTYGAGAPDAVYKIHLNSPMNLLIDLCGSSFDTVVYVRTNLYDPNSAVGLNDDSDLCNAASRLVTGTLPAGDYYVIVDGYYSDSYGSFNLNISQFATNCVIDTVSPAPEVEPNNDDTNFSNPTALGVVSVGNDVAGSGKVDEFFDTVDTWKFTVGVPGVYTVSLDCFDDSNHTTHMGFDLLDSNHNLVDSSSDVVEPDQLIENLSAGTYYVAVYPHDQQGHYTVGGDYHLIVQASAPAVPTPEIVPNDGSVLTLNGDTSTGVDSYNQAVPADGVTFGKGAPDVVYALSVTQTGIYSVQCNSSGGGRGILRVHLPQDQLDRPE